MNKTQTQETTPFAGHTPGPWFRMDKRYRDDERPRIHIATFRDDGFPDQLVATVNDCDINPLEEHTESVKANARLIASAPALLASNAALVSALEDARNTIDLAHDQIAGKVELRNLLNCTFERTQAALSEARKVMEGRAEG